MPPLVCWPSFNDKLECSKDKLTEAKAYDENAIGVYYNEIVAWRQDDAMFSAFKTDLRFTRVQETQSH